MIRYSVLATLASSEVLEEYTSWLKNGHIKKVVDEGGALSGDFSILQTEDMTQVVSSFIFSNKMAYEEYAAGVAVRLRPEGVSLFVETKKVTKFDRMITEIKHSYRNTVEYSLAEVTPYLYFNGNCRQAMEFYKSCFEGSSLDIMSYEGTPAAEKMSPEASKSVMHSWLNLSSKARLMASDAPADTAVTIGDNIALCVNTCSVEEITELYGKLSVDGEILLPLEDQFWGGKFAQFVDKFGVLWMLHLHLSENYKCDVIELIPYLQFNGECRQIMNDIKSALGGTMQMMTYASSPAKDTFPPETWNNVLHCCMNFNNNICNMMGSDVATPLPAVTRGTNVSISLLFKDNDKVNTAFETLGLGGKVLEPLENQFWGGLFGHLEDKHGIRWMVVGPHPGESASPEAKKARNE